MTRALLDAGHRALGLCNVAIGFQRHFAALVDADPSRVMLDHVGLNHLTWERAAIVDGVDVLPGLIAAHGDEVAEHTGLPAAVMHDLGAVPSYYLHYFYEHDAVVERQRHEPTRAEEVARLERELLVTYADPALDHKPEMLSQRGGAFYSEAAALRALGWSQTTAVANDTFAVLRAGLDPDVLARAGRGPAPAGGGESRAGHWGVAVTCGAGINCVGVDPAGRTTGYLALGGISGDWGGGSGLGQAALWWAARAEDGRGPQTALRQAVPAHFGVPTVRDVTISIHLGKINDETLRELAPVLLAVAAAGDEVARNLVIRQAEEISVMALTAMRRLGLTALPTPVVLGGGVLTASDPLLITEITNRITAAAPGAVMIVAAVPPIAGAALLGLDHIGAGPDAERRLRAAYDGRAAS